jgi:tetratricopeptide (TPR) repeat protein
VERFTDAHDRLMYHAVLAQEEGDREAHRQTARTAARVGLDLFGLGDNGPPFTPRFDDDLLAGDVRQWLTESCYVMYFFLADLESATPAATREEEHARAHAALRVLDRATGLGLDTRSYHERRAELLLALGEAAGARVEQRRAAAVPASAPVDHFLLGTAANRVGKLADAEAHLRHVLHKEPKHFWANYYLAGCVLRSRPRHLERALAPLTTCVELKPRFVWPFLLRGFVHGELNDFDAAFADFAAAEQLDRDQLADYGLLVNRAVVRLRQGKVLEGRGLVWWQRVKAAGTCYVRAVAELERAAALRPKQPHAHANLAEAHLRLGRPKEALAQLNIAVKLTPTDTLHRNRSAAHARLGDFAAALSDLEEAIRRAPGAQAQGEVAGDQLQRGRILFRLAKYQAALEASSKALAADPALAAAHQLRGETLLEMGRVKEAVAALDAYQAKGPPSALAARALGLGHARLGDYFGAIEDYSRALALDRAAGKPADAPTLAYRGWAYLTLDAPKLALRDFDAALRVPGDHQADCHAGRGYARVLLGMWRPAVTDAEAALAAGTPTARVQYNAARVYAQAVARVLADPELPQKRVSQELSGQYRRQALRLLRGACEDTPAEQRAAFWKEYVHADPALAPVRRTDDYVKMALEFGGGKP